MAHRVLLRLEEKGVELWCFTCNKPGHIVRNCSNKSMINRLMACMEKAKEKTIVEDVDDVGQPRIGAL